MVGTVEINRIELPRDVKKMKLLYIKWVEKQDVYLIST